MSLAVVSISQFPHIRYRNILMALRHLMYPCSDTVVESLRQYRSTMGVLVVGSGMYLIE